MLSNEQIKTIIGEAEKGIDIYADYRDKLGKENLKEIFAAVEKSDEDPIAVFKDWLAEKYDEWLWDYDYSTDAKYVCKNVGIDFDALDEDDRETAVDTFRENTFFNLPYSHYLGQKIPVNIRIDTGDANYDFGINEVYPHYNGDYDTLAEDGVPDESALAWLVEQQGYSKEDLKKALLGDEEVPSKFLTSIRDEVANMSSSCPSLVFMMSMTVEEWLQALNAPHIHIPKNARCGLVNFWAGGGSILDIRLEKDMDIPKKVVFEILPDYLYGYGILDVYGVTESFYDV